jgi:two-component system, NtrC family, C4-dicarboxylate transport sensor histidine kinase DctB
MRWDFRIARGLTFGVAAVCLAGAVWWAGLGQSLDQLSQRGASDLALASDRLVKSLTRYRELIVVLADDEQFDGPAPDPEGAARLLRRAADLTGALDLMLLDRDGQVVASASGARGVDWRDDAFVDRALTGALGSFHAISDRFLTRAFYFSAPIFSAEGPVEGALVAVVDLDRIEAEGRGAIPVVLFTDEDGVVISSNRSELVLMRRDGEGRSAFPENRLRPFFSYQTLGVRGTDVWRTDAGPYVPKRALHVEQRIEILGLRAEALLDARPAYVTAGLQGTVAGVLAAFFGTVIFLTTERRRALARANAALEVRVAERTDELSRINLALRDEVAERREAEAALKRAQDELVQVGKLSALGQMSAGISHELNQPLMAIRSFAENGTRFLEMGKGDMVAGNLAKIADLAARAGRIIKNLKAFARQESEPSTRVDLCAVARAAIEMTEAQFERDAVGVTAQIPDAPVWVTGGEVRLTQVVVNLLTNAADAMSSLPEKSLTLTVAASPEPSVTVRDSGPGIADPSRIFEPFYTTKSVGDGEGTGLGLSISYGLVQSFGGDISGENAPGGGAVFTVRLQPWREERAA